MKGIRLYVAVGLGALLLLGVLTRPDRAVERWIGKREALLERVERSEREVKNLRAAERAWQATFEAFRTSAAARDTVFRTRVVQVQTEPVPATCGPAVAVRDSLIRACEVARDEYRDKWYEERRHAAGLLQDVNRLNSLLSDAGNVVEEAPVKRSFFRALIPKPGLQATAGLDIHGRPNAVVGIGLSWSF